MPANYTSLKLTPWLADWQPVG